MGNVSSFSGCSLMSGVVLKVVLLDGRVEAYRSKAKRAGEVMLEYPGHFVCDSAFLKVGHRIQGLLPDQHLQRRKFYFLLPMELLYSVLTHEEMNSLNYKYKYKASRPMKHTTFSNLALPKRFQGHQSTQLLWIWEPQPQPQPLQNYSNHRSWRPALETIHEIP